jgi:hypothetical protein
MSTTKASDIYHDHVRALPIVERLKLIALIARDLEIEHGECEEKPRHSIMELQGIGKGAWGGIDAQEYVNRLRDGWEEPPP